MRLSGVCLYVQFKKQNKTPLLYFSFDTWCVSKTLRLAFFPLAIAEIKLHLNCSCDGFVMVWRNFKYDVCL